MSSTALPVSAVRAARMVQLSLAPLKICPAESAGMVVSTADASTSGSAGASFVGRGTPGTSRLVVDDTRGVVVGATFVGFEVAEMLHAATIAVLGEVPLDRIAHAVPCFPTRSEVWLSLLEAAGY